MGIAVTIHGALHLLWMVPLILIYFSSDMPIDKRSVCRYNLIKKGVMSLDTIDTGYDKETGLPKSKKYLERGLPPYLQSSLENMIASWKMIDSGRKDLHWDIYWCELNADINAAETEQEISAEQAWYLRENYLRIKRGD